MHLIRLTKENIENEHICCAIAGSKDPQVQAKKAWLTERLGEGLEFLKGDVRGKCFIEYIPAEYAWAPIEADGYHYIDCFWVAGQFKGQGHANELLDACIRDSREKGKRGLCVLSSAKKRPFLSDPGYLAHRGFSVADTAEPYYTLLYLPFSEGAQPPSFREQARRPRAEGSGFAVYYTHGCPYTAKYVPLIEAVAKEHGIPFRSVLIDSREAAQNAPAAWTAYAVFYDGAYITNEILSEKKFLAMAEQLQSGTGTNG